MPAPVEPVDLLDLKLLPAWLKEPADPRSYEHYEGEDEERGSRRGDQHGRGARRPRTGGRDRRPDRGGPKRPDNRGGGERRGPRGDRDGRRDGGPRRGPDRGRPPRHGHGPDRGPRPDHLEKDVEALASKVTVRFVPHDPVFENVAAQIKANPVAYSVFALARLFLEKPERYDVQLTAKEDTSPLYQLGDNSAVAADQRALEAGAFRIAQNDFYRVEVTETEPIKGNFTSVARDRASGTLLGPTNHHSYQPKLRGLYEQRYSRRMSFPDFQRQIEIVNDPAVVEQWKEEARKVTTFVTLKEEPPVTFNNVNEAEHHFRKHYLPGLLHPVTQQVVPGVVSRRLPDRVLRKLVENAWARETRSPSQMMQEISNKLREASLQIFRHRKGALFVDSVRVRPFAHEETSVSPQVQSILQSIAAKAGIGRKELADNLLAGVAGEDAEARKLSLASDLKWLISEGYVIEFNDGSLDLPRAKVKPVGEKKAADAAEKPNEQTAEATVANTPTAVLEDGSTEQDLAFPKASSVAEEDVEKPSDSEAFAGRASDQGAAVSEPPPDQASAADSAHKLSENQ